ncbi:hypothetical protein EMCRGX_G033664 [Ephydatia muelleri]
MELHRDQLQKRCRVCGSLLVAKGKKRRAFYQCSEFKECLFRAFSIDINNDLPDIHPVSLCYSCKQIMDRPMTCYSSTAITEWEVHAADRCMKNIHIGDYNIHDCDVKPTKDEVKMASQVLSKLAATSPDKTISIPTDGLVCPPGLHMTQGIFMKVFRLLEDACHSYDMQLAFINQTTNSTSSFSAYCVELHKLQMLKAKYAECKAELADLEEVMTSVAVCLGKDDSITNNFIKQVNEKKRSVQQMEKEIAHQSNAVEKGFKKHEGPFVQGLDTALQSFKVKRQQYFGGVFVGNHIHKALKPSNISIMCSSMIQVAHEKCPTLVETVSATAEKFTTVFSLLGRCHSIYDQLFIDELKVTELEHAISEFMESFRASFPSSSISLKMHLLEDHTVPWAKRTGTGFGLLGEQGAESIHARFNTLSENLSMYPQQGRPTLREILSFSSKTKTVNLAQQIGIRGIDVGVHLLEDDSGARVEGIAAENRSIEDTNRQILKQWLQGSGMKPVAWSTLTKAMRKAGLFDLAAEVDDAMNAEGKKRQDCWAIVSVKALRITTRQHVDIVAVIDNSGSMAGMKIQLVKETLLRLIHLLDERDRIALLTYNTSVKQHFALQEATAENKQIFQNAISSIIADGQTNLCDGLMKGIEMLAYNRGTKSAPVQSVLLLSDGEATEGVTVCEKIIKEMNQVECYSGSVYTFAFGNDCNHEMMEAIASHGKGVCYFIDSLEKIAPSFGHCLGGLKTTVAQNLSLHIEMQEDNRINTVHCHDAVQWLKEDKICNLSIQDIQCGEEKCVALTLILPRLMEEKADTVLKGTLSFLDTGSSENKLQDFQLHLQRADRCCSDSSDYQVDQQRNRILAIEAINNLKKSGNCQKARNHMSELINTISVSVSNSSPWTQNLIRDLKECMALFPEPIQAKQRRKHQKSTSLKHFPSKISYSSSQHEQTNILLDLKAYDLSEEDNQPKIEAHSYQLAWYCQAARHSKLEAAHHSKLTWHHNAARHSKLAWYLKATHHSKLEAAHHSKLTWHHKAACHSKLAWYRKAARHSKAAGKS